MRSRKTTVKILDAALSAFYPLLVIMGILIVLRFAPLLRAVENNTKPLICSTILIVVAVMWEQILYGYGRFSGEFITIATTPWLVGIGKVMFMVGFGYMSYAFWLLSPTKPKLWVSLAFVFSTWAVIATMLLF